MNLNSSRKQFTRLTTNNPVIKGTLILTIAGFASRMIGFYNRIFLSGLIGATEMGIYQLIFPLYMVAFSFTTYGNEIALTKLVSEYKGRNQLNTARSFFRTCFTMNLLLGLLISTIMYQNADWLCIHVLNAPECTTCLQVICLGIPFMAMKGAIHGYFLGLENSAVHGVSDFLEQLGKVFGLYLLATYICIRNSYDASFAVWGIVLGECIAFLYSVIALIRHYKKCPATQNDQPIHKQKIISLFLKNSVPLTTNRLALTILQSIEAIMVPTVLLLFYKSSTQSLAIYGVFSGMAFPFIMFPSTITNSLSTMLLPAVSSASSSLNNNYLRTLCEKSLHFCLLIGIFSTIAFYIFGPDIGILFFKSKEAGIYLYQLSFLCPFIYLATTFASILNGFGYAGHNLILTCIATIIRITFIQLMIPNIGIAGYILGLFASYLFLTFASLYKLQKLLVFEIHFLESIFLPGCIFTLTGVGAFFLYKHLSPLATSNAFQILLMLAIIALWGLLVFPPYLITIYKARQQPR